MYKRDFLMISWVPEFQLPGYSEEMCHDEWRDLARRNRTPIKRMHDVEKTFRNARLLWAHDN